MKIIDPQDWFSLTDPPILFDVRSPGEFTKGHWPGAQSLPLFDDQERAEVGTLYKQVSPDTAFLKGLELAGQKMRWYVEEARRLAPDKRIAIHCWRGGQRSQSMGWLLDKAFAEVQVIQGGYKALRNAGRAHMEAFSRPLMVLGGPTGSSKTKVLHILEQRQETIVDLEGLARHKGSAFGALGEEGQPSVEQFENDLFHYLLQLATDTQKPVWVEDESKAIGRVYIPNELWAKMMKAPLVVIDMPQEWRLDNLVEDYAHYDLAELKNGFERIRKRLGGQHLKRALEALDQQDFYAAAAIAIKYYDKAYRWSLERSERKAVYHLQPSANQPEVIASELLEWYAVTSP